MQSLARRVQTGTTQALASVRAVEERTLTYLRDWLPTRLLERLFQMTQAIARHILPGAAATAAQFPRPPGSYLAEDRLGTPALAFVRTVCALLALDSSIADEVCPPPSTRAAPRCSCRSVMR